MDVLLRVLGGFLWILNRFVLFNVVSVLFIFVGLKKIDLNMKVGVISEGVLVNFFNSLLSKKIGFLGGFGVSGGSFVGGVGGGSSGLLLFVKKLG